MAGKSGLVKLFEPAIEWMAFRYQRAVGNELRKYGLRYDDLLCQAYSLDIDEAIKRLPPGEEDARNQRLKRASDCSLKKSYLPKEVQEQQTPFAFYLKDSLEQVEAENAERALLGTSKPYDRSIP